jgi:hypothetical protein
MQMGRALNEPFEAMQSAADVLREALCAVSAPGRSQALVPERAACRVVA